jgi:hypothetical protein
LDLSADQTAHILDDWAKKLKKVREVV